MDLNHLHLGVDDIDRSARVCERFGFREQTWHGDALFLTNDHGFELALAPHGRADMPPWFHVGFKLDSPDTVRDLRSTCAVHAAGDDPDFVWFRTADPDGYQLEIYWEP